MRKRTVRTKFEQRVKISQNASKSTSITENRPVCHLFGFTRVSSVKICCISPSDSEANRDGSDAESPFPLFFPFSASFKNSSPREKVTKLSSFWDWWAESLFVFIIVAKYNIFPCVTMAARAKKNSGEAICSRYQRTLSGF